MCIRDSGWGGQRPALNGGLGQQPYTSSFGGRAFGPWGSGSGGGRGGRGVDACMAMHLRRQQQWPPNRQNHANNRWNGSGFVGGDGAVAPTRGRKAAETTAQNHRTVSALWVRKARLALEGGTVLGGAATRRGVSWRASGNRCPGRTRKGRVEVRRRRLGCPAPNRWVLHHEARHVTRSSRVPPCPAQCMFFHLMRLGKCFICGAQHSTPVLLTTVAVSYTHLTLPTIYSV